MLKGVDLSHWNSVNDFEYLYNFADFFILKATESTTGTDKCFLTRMNKLQAGSKMTGCYHFFRNSEPMKQLNNFMKCYNLYIGRTIPIIDVENLGTNWNYVKVFVETFRKNTGKRMIIYVDNAHYRAMPSDLKRNYPIWIARYNSTYSFAKIRELYPEAVMWQSSDKCQFAGRKMNVDNNYYFGTIEDMKSYL